MVQAKVQFILLLLVLEVHAQNVLSMKTLFNLGTYLLLSLLYVFVSVSVYGVHVSCAFLLLFMLYMLLTDS